MYKTHVAVMDGMDGSVEIAAPELEELVQSREVGCQVIVLPDERLKERTVVGEPVQDFCRDESVVQ